MEYARLDGDTIIERRELDSIPAHKAALWRLVVYEGDGDLSDTIVESDRIRIVRSMAPLDQVKAALCAQVDADAETVRLRYITPGAGMAMTYAEKRDQANAVHAMGQEAANALSEAERIARFPTLAASVGLEAATLWDCAQLVIAKSEAWADLSNVIERTRLLGKKSISDASDSASARAAYEAIAWTV